jgi:hypothetical protein
MADSETRYGDQPRIRALMADVSTPVAEYVKAAPLWSLVEDATAGEAAIKAAGQKYLPRLNPQDKGPENNARNADYVFRAVYYNASGRTLEGLVGLAFAKEPEVTVPTDIDDIVTNIDGAGTNLVQHMHDTLGEVVKNGRAGLFVDFPKTVGPTSRADEKAAGIRPTVTYYPALSIINWRTIVIGGQAKLSLVVLREKHCEFDGFGETEQDQYRVLELVGGVYQVTIWRQTKGADGKIEWRAVGTSTPADGAGNEMSEIPFTFIGSRNNTPAINKAPLADLATLNVAHYRNSADYEDSAHLVGQPQFYIAGLDETWVKMLEEKGIYVGSRSILPLPTGGTADILQAQPNTMCKEAMDAKEKQMAALGARLIQPDRTIKTATQQNSEDSVAHSVLSLCCDNVSDGYERALMWAAQFANVRGDIAVELSTEFTKFTLDAQELTALIGAVQSGLLPKTDFWSRLRLGGIIDPKKDDMAVQEELDQNPPLGLGAPGNPNAAVNGGDPNAGAGA